MTLLKVFSDQSVPRGPEWLVVEQEAELLSKKYGVPYECMVAEYPLKVQSRTVYLDIAIFSTMDTTRWNQFTTLIGIVEAKRALGGDNLQEAERQLKTYMAAVPQKIWGRAVKGSERSNFRKGTGSPRIVESPVFPKWDDLKNGTTTSLIDQYIADIPDERMSLYRKIHKELSDYRETLPGGGSNSWGAHTKECQKCQQRMDEMDTCIHSDLNLPLFPSIYVKRGDGVWQITWRAIRPPNDGKESFTEYRWGKCARMKDTENRSPTGWVEMIEELSPPPSEYEKAVYEILNFLALIDGGSVQFSPEPKNLKREDFGK